MAEAAVDTSRFFCHSCSTHFAMTSSEFKCPHCDSGFVEQIDQNSSLNNAAPSDVDVEGPSTNGPTALDLLRGSLMHYWPNVASPEGEAPDSVSFFSINFEPESSRGQSTSDEQQSTSTSTSTPTATQPPGGERPRYNFRIRTRRRINPPSSTAIAGSSESTSNPIDAQSRNPQNFLEGFLQQFLSGELGGAGAGAGILGNNAAGNSPWGMFTMPIHGNPGDYAWGTNGLDDVITQLLGQLDNSGAPPASASTIEKLPVLIITEKHVEANEDCSVCMDTFVIEEEAKRLPCEHFFHIRCIDPWLELHNTCPICRTNIEDSSSCPMNSSSQSAPSTSGPSTSGV